MGDNNKKGRIRTKGVCPECGSNNVYLSKYRGLEGVVASFLPRNVFRCLDCNERFWASEALFANASRVWALILSSFAILVVVLLFFQSGDSQTDLSRKAEFIPQFDSQLNSQNEQGSSQEKQLSAALSGTNVDQGLDEQLLDSVENKAKVNDAKNQSEQISDTIKSSIDRLELAFIEDQKALVSLLKIDINHAIESWRKAWQSGATKNYLSFYSNDFKPSNFLPLKEWIAQRESRVKPGSGIEVNLTDFDVSLTDENKRAVALFTQSYFSKKYAEVSRKRLVLVSEQDEWKIVSEREVN